MHSLFLLLFSFQNPSFLDQSIHSARERIAREPKHPDGYNDLALALARKERETGDPEFLQQADDAVASSLRIQPANFEGRKARVAIRLRQHRYEDALEEALALNQQTPDDNALYGFISEAQIALGNYKEAEAAVQRMIDLRPVNGPGMERGAVIRELIGYPEAALDWWNSALHLMADRDSEARAFILTQMARIHRETGKYEAAGGYAQQALTLVPGYPPGLEELARILIDQDKGSEAAPLLRRRLKAGPSVAALYWLARAEDSAMAGAEFEKAASGAEGSALLIRYLTEHGRAAQAVEAGRAAAKRHHDLFTLDAYAWALFQSGKPVEAKEQMARALAPGMRDAELFYHAGAIAKAAGDAAAAVKYFKHSLEINASSPVSGRVIQELAGMARSSSS
jgi:tetratricopeptide (TPR) repeat protein